jgi:CheY-like chemotaxis protein
MKPRVLVVDDEQNLRFTLVEVLRDEGYAVSSAADGQGAVDLCEQEHFDVILMDVRMPGLNGVEAFRRIRRHQQDVRVIMMSGYSVDELREAAVREGATFVSKPLDIEQIMQLVESNP